MQGKVAQRSRLWAWLVILTLSAVTARPLSPPYWGRSPLGA